MAWGCGYDFDSVIPRGRLSPKGPVGSLIVCWEMGLVLDVSPPIFVRNILQASVLRRQSPASVGVGVLAIHQVSGVSDFQGRVSKDLPLRR